MTREMGKHRRQLFDDHPQQLRQRGDAEPTSTPHARRSTAHSSTIRGNSFGSDSSRPSFTFPHYSWARFHRAVLASTVESQTPLILPPCRIRTSTVTRAFISDGSLPDLNLN
ncbi:hypothetical protein R3P38DRAFT_3204717 [Favolaschia claudopus]|uniref:Uncharacterized protein n=1 Tax=Favolaschia claudopus TaxID=2862362 RepID=A0AAW0AQZ6_9AGAR